MISLRKLMLKDINGMLEWMKDKNLHKYFKINPNSANENSVKSFILHSYSEVERHFAIVNEYDEYLGTISLKNIDYEAGTAEYAISMRAQAKGTGAASEATRDILNKAFFEMGLHKVYLNVYSDNERAIKFYDKEGFHHEGTFRDHICVDGIRRSLEWFAIFEEDYRV